MEKRKTIFNYLKEASAMMGLMTIVIALFCLVFGESAKSLSSLFRLGNQGLPIDILFQLAGISLLVTIGRALFFTDMLIKQMSIAKRIVCMMVTMIIIMCVFISVFHWFPLDMWEPWLMFFLCYFTSFIISLGMTSWIEKKENERMQKALNKLKEREAR